ncbi:hypothetical protein GE061_008260 [Apolygus lucorum]|uniref:Uncharacterized protein n=1 Tax=Apolygus lucorum TaxID=248454 RepID=A0A8S9WP43_APOLU|nr:hypothetical protein GE061_008260 [Apolygus lucorum]
MKSFLALTMAVVAMAWSWGGSSGCNDSEPVSTPRSHTVFEMLNPMRIFHKLVESIKLVFGRAVPSFLVGVLSALKTVLGYLLGYRYAQPPKERLFSSPTIVVPGNPVLSSVLFDKYAPTPYGLPNGGYPMEPNPFWSPRRFNGMPVNNDRLSDRSDTQSEKRTSGHKSTAKDILGQTKLAKSLEKVILKQNTAKRPLRLADRSYHVSNLEHQKTNRHSKIPIIQTKASILQKSR